MATAFCWECEAFRVALAPWLRDRKRQRVVQCRVAAAEQRTPGFALRFDLELPDGTKLLRLVTQRQMLEAFEFAFVGKQASARRPPGGEEAGDEGLDQRLKAWLAGGGQVQPPPKDELARWLLAWMLVTPAEAAGDKQPDEWLVLLCGETDEEETEEELTFRESDDQGEPVSDGNDKQEQDDDVSDGETEDDEDLPPPYQEVEEALESSGMEVESGDEENATSLDEECEVRPVETTQTSSSSRTLPREGQKVVKRGSTRRSFSNRSLASTAPSSSAMEQKDKSVLKPAIVRLNPRLDSLEAVKSEEPSSEWSEDRRHFQQELRASRQDVRIAKQQRDKVERLAQVRHTQLMNESARKLRANERKRRDAKAVRQLIADTLEYRDELSAMESRVKHAAIAAQRSQERVRLQTRVVLGNTEKASRGAIKLGPGPLSKKEMELINGDTRDESAAYDLHGRRHNLQDAGQIAQENALESAMRKLRRLLLDSGKSVDIFRQYDLNSSGTLSYNEFQRMLRANGCELTTEQSSAFFTRFDFDDSGEIDYKELLWGFFNWEAFVKRWHERKSAGQTEKELKRAFERYDPASRGVLPTKEFQLALDHLGVTVSDVDAKLLGVKFDAGKNDFINYHEFLSSIANDGAPAANEKPRGRARAEDSQKPVAAAGMERIWAELQDLAATQARLHRLLRK